MSVTVALRVGGDCKERQKAATKQASLPTLEPTQELWAQEEDFSVHSSCTSKIPELWYSTFTGSIEIQLNFYWLKKNPFWSLALEPEASGTVSDELRVSHAKTSGAVLSSTNRILCTATGKADQNSTAREESGAATCQDSGPLGPP